MKMGWTADERLCCILEQGNAYIYDLKGNSHVVSLGEDAQQFGVLDAAISRNNSIVILTGICNSHSGNYKFVVISDFMDARPKAMPGFGLNSIPDSWTILPGENSPTGNPEILVAFQNTIYQIDTIKAQDQVISN